MQFRSAVQELVADMDQDVDAVIVEGPRDREALERAGFTQRIYTCSETNGLIGFARSVSDEGSIAILTDFDEEGKKLNGRLRELIPGSHIQSIWRKKLGRVMTEHGRRDIESLNNVFSGKDDQRKHDR